MLSTLSLLFFFIFQFARACEYDPAVCARDEELLCKVQVLQTDAVQSFYNSRVCLRKNRKSISKQCLDYLELDQPSIIESCLAEITTFCDVLPGCFRVHRCLSEVVVDDISLGCQEALDKDQESFQAIDVIIEKEIDEEFEDVGDVKEDDDSSERRLW